jgi:hypothetical protein
LRYGIDTAPLTSLKPRATKLVESLKVTSGEREKIFWCNAAKPLKPDMPNQGQ